MIKTIVKSVLEAEVSAIIHSCNCFCQFGSGLAAAIRLKYPEANAADQKTTKGDKNKLSTIIPVKLTTNPRPKNLEFVINLYGQYTFGTEKRQTSYDALVTGFEAVRDFAVNNGLKSLAVPYKIGSDRGGACWYVVEAILESIFGDYDDLPLFICKLS